MTKDQIKAELRRSACEDDDPIDQCDYYAWSYTRRPEFRNCLTEDLSGFNIDVARTFFLLVAEAL